MFEIQPTTGLNMDNIISEKLQQAAQEARSTDERLDFDDVAREMRGNLKDIARLI